MNNGEREDQARQAGQAEQATKEPPPPSGRPALPKAEPPTIPDEERALAALTHLSGLAGYIIPLGGVLVPIVIWVVKSESRIIAAIAKQAIILNVLAFLAIICSLVLALTIILIPFLILFWIALGLAAVVLPIIGALKAHEGVYYQYPIIGVDLR
jgi:uncharacterized Tic20 family protein